MTPFFTIVTAATGTDTGQMRSYALTAPVMDERAEKAGSVPLVSVITVCRNAEKTIQRTLNSVAAQTYPVVEHIVIDGDSKDGTLDIVKACPSVTRWISEPDKGIADAFNKGLAQTRGEWIGILNADDWYEPDAIAVAMLHAAGADVVHGAVRYWKGDAVKEVYHCRQDKLRLEMTINHPSIFVRRALYEELGGFDADYRYAMDYELVLRFMVNGARFATVNQIIANMSYGGVSDTSWRMAAVECARAKMTHLRKPVSAVAYCIWQLSRGAARRALEKVGLGRTVREFRKRYSIQRKT